MPDPIRYTFARAFASEAAARDAWQAAARAATARPDNVSVTRALHPGGAARRGPGRPRPPGGRAAPGAPAPPGR